MRKQHKRLLSMLMVGMMMLSLVPTSVFATDNTVTTNDTVTNIADSSVDTEKSEVSMEKIVPAEEVFPAEEVKNSTSEEIKPEAEASTEPQEVVEEEPTSDATLPEVDNGTASEEKAVNDTVVEGTVEVAAPVAEMNGTKYETLQAAVDAADGTVTITLLGDFEGNGVKVPSGKNITFDFAGHTYTINTKTVGSTGTATNGFQLLKNSNITFKNGTLKAGTSAKILIQNYSNLTVENMNLIGGTQTQCVLSNNNGNIVLSGNTNITATEGNVAFDVNYWPSNGYGDIKLTTANLTGKITGKIAYTHDNGAATEETAKHASIVITSGKFTADVSAYLPEGYKLTLVDGVYTATAIGPVAEISGNEYATLEEAVAAAVDGDVIVLLQDTEISQTIALNKNVTLNLGGYTVAAGKDLAGNGGRNFMFSSTADVTIKNGNITSDVSRGIGVNSGNFKLEGVNVTTIKRALFLDNAIVTVDRNSSLVIANGGQDAPVVVWGSGDYKTDGQYQHPTLNFYGKADATKAAQPFAAITGNGTDKSYTCINIGDGAQLISNGHALYHPQAGEATISGGTLTGDGAVGIKSGKLNITGGKLVANGAYSADIESMSGGINCDGSVIVVDSNNAYAGEMVISISGNAQLTSANGHVVREVGKSDDATSIVSLNVTGGTLTSGTGKDSINVRNITEEKVSVTGGNYTVDPTEHLSEGYVAVESNGVYTVVKAIPVAEMNGKQYYTLQAAVDAAGGDATITLLGDFEGNGVKVPSGKNITFDFAGHTYTINAKTVGSTGTATNGFQLLKNSNITFKNGTLKAGTSAKILIQNYSNLTVENMNLIGGTQTQYVLSNNNGNIVLSGNTNITATEGNVAFDVYYWPSNGYGDIRVKTDEFTGIVTGKIDYTHDNSVTAEEAAKHTSITITSGDFTVDPSAYVPAGYTHVKMENGMFTVAEKAEDTVVVADNAFGNQVTSEEKEQAKNATSGITVDGLKDANTDKITAADEQKANQLGVDSLHIQTHMDITLEQYQPNAIMRVNITPKTGVYGTDSHGKTVLIREEVMDTTGKNVPVTMPVPAGFAAENDKLTILQTTKDGRQVSHKVTVKNGADGLYVSFDNTDGFGTFEIIRGVKENKWTTEPANMTRVYDGTGVAPDAAAEYGTVKITYRPAGTKQAFTDTIPINAGVYDVRFAVDATDYSSALEKTATLTINKKPIKVTANNVSKLPGKQDPKLTYTVNGLVSGDTLYGNLEREPGEELGKYKITQGTLNNANYQITFVGATFTITTNPKTGDSSAFLLWNTLFAASAVVLVTAVTIRYKKRSDEQ